MIEGFRRLIFFVKVVIEGVVIYNWIANWWYWQDPRTLWGTWNCIFYVFILEIVAFLLLWVIKGFCKSRI